MDTLIILAGGKGERLKDRLGDLPKPLIDINGKPLLERQIEWAKANGITRVIIYAGFRGDRIKRYFREHEHSGIEVQVILETPLAGTAGAVLHDLRNLPEQFVLLYGDLMISAPLRPMLDFHERMDAAVTLYLHWSTHPKDSDLVTVDVFGWIKSFCRDHEATKGISSAGLYVLKRSALRPYDSLEQPLDFGRHIFPLMIVNGDEIAGYIGKGYIKDIGTPERYDEVCAKFAEA